MTSSSNGGWPLVELSRLAAFGNYPDFDVRPGPELKTGSGFAFHLNFNESHPGYDQWIIERITGEGEFLNANDMDDKDFEEVVSWATENRLVRPVTYWKLTYYEHDRESAVPCWEIKRSREEAERQISEMHECDETESLTPMLVLDLVDDLRKFSHIISYDASEVLSVVRTLFARDVLRTDGVIYYYDTIPARGFGHLFHHAFDKWVWSRV